MAELRRIIQRPLFTEKSMRQQEWDNQYAFAVDPEANKPEIAEAIERLFDVRVVKVRTQNHMGKIRTMGRFAGRRPDWKKAIVTLEEGDVIDLYEGMI
ncbi:MAG: 50S ribosomal protein L23 [Gemmatimonadota bacterium]|nr:50S ribosomal protein L23 [Gemmatimonadota bacterium]